MANRIKNSSRPRVADEIMAGVRELERMMDEGKKPEELFTVRIVVVPDPSFYRPKQIRAFQRLNPILNFPKA